MTKKPDQTSTNHNSKTPDGCLVGIALGFVICVICMVLPLIAESEWPSPPPYPGSVSVQIKYFGGSGITSYANIYTIDVSIDVLQRYYSDQMSLYCIDAWQFVKFDDPGQFIDPYDDYGRYIYAYDTHSSGMKAGCRVRHPYGQDFYVKLFPITLGQTKVGYSVVVSTRII